jgi:hypothetical protein
VFGAPELSVDHADRARRGCGDARIAVGGQPAVGRRGPAALGIGVSTGVVAAALLGSEERLNTPCCRRRCEPVSTTAAVRGFGEIVVVTRHGNN